jgi:hypothetical protein
MAADPGGMRKPLALRPPGQPRSRGLVELAARAGGYLVGAVVDGAARTFLAESDGHLVLLMWPDGYSARFSPLEVLDEEGQVVAKGGEFLTLGGGFLVKQDDPRTLGHDAVFAANPLPAHGAPRR